ncbi:MAG: HIT family protein [Nanoarchaeota archaeon]|nr:HIT family protein [Nanoarchaeota archaeon]
MADCAFCAATEHVLFEDADIKAVLAPEPAVPGHTLVLPKQHVTIFEQVPDKIIGRLFSLANKVSSALFETMKVQGTNVFIENGVAAGQKIAHFAIHILPRKEGDGIDLQWQTRQLSEEEMATIELKLKEKPMVPQEPAKKQLAEDNYLWRSWNRRPG